MPIVVLGADKLVAQFEAKAVASQLAVDVADDAIGNEVVALAKSIVPVLTGNLRDSITYEHVGGGLGRVFTDVVYAGQVEFGGLHNPPEPYLRPAIDTVNTEEAMAAAWGVIDGA